MIRMENAIDALKKLGIAAQLYGEGKDIVICVHGWLDNSNSFKPMLDKANTDFTYIAVDLKGHGQSQWRSGDYYFIDYVYDLLTIMDELGIEQCHLLGHSLGAMVCGLFSALYPQRIKSLVMLEGIGLVCTEPDQMKQQVMESFEQRAKIDRFKPRLYANFETLAKVRSNVGDISTEDAALLMQRNTQKVEGGFSLTTDPQLKARSGFRYTQAQALALLKDVNVPSLLILGTKGYDFVQQNIAVFGRSFNRLEVEKISGGHHCHMDNPKVCIELIERHMNRNVVT
ncbi:2-succinyl-6-hydroxy-2, 4-cyclohexadiene-1-carboxylate synthase [Pseudoalteromonas sp. CIP111854]|uniref:2-succinyl-6-hydroxy-2, 4-cyclohexadiene-1-carboxylate synthase n=2 Tax=Pseudoalteromonas holothuriae TaxID=2963714 RepID=A0A9W4R134_9GAMM|nr:2-succinyl-6-hydroxy-2, 4-cyclohexadiene-1-carboxylate synthase [Pseudoalteromonas sp. CIP111854]